MTNSQSVRKPRIQVVDAIRGFALFGILILHAIEHFELCRYPETSSGFLTWSDPAIFKALFFIFGGKAYSMFSIMFGFSFFIQMDNQAGKGVDFRMRFIWRLVVLFVFGYLHALMYQGDVLTVFALLGLPLVLMYKLTNKVLIWLCVLFLIQIPTLYNIILSFLDPGFVFQQDWSIFEHAFQTFAEGSFQEVIRFNSFSGHLAKWTFTYNTGRYLQMVGLFIIGILLGRYKFFENIDKNKRLVFRIFAGSVIGFVILYSIQFALPVLKLYDTQTGLIGSLSTSWANLFFTSLLVSGFILIYLAFRERNKFNLLASYGRMSLTNYVLQPLIGVLVFYGYGLGMYQYMGVTISLGYGILFFILQLLFCKYWFRYFYYGPLEWLWRAITFFDFNIKFKRISP